MAGKSSHDLLKIGAAGAAAFGLYEFWWKPRQDAAAAAALLPLTSSAPYTVGGGGATTLPYVTSPTAPVGIQPSNLDPGAAVGGPVGTAMHRKNWTQAQATQRINDLTAGYQAQVAALASLQSGQALATINAAIAANQAALASAAGPYNAAVASGDAAGALIWKNAIDAHNADITALNNRLQSIAGQITAYKNNIAGLQSDYYNLTGLTLG